MRHFLFFSLLTFPASALASGGDVLSLLWLELLLLIAVVSSVFFAKITMWWRLTVFVAYCLGQALAYGLVGQLPYLEHKLVVDFTSIAVPLGAWLAALLLAWRSCKHNKSFKRTPNGAA